MEFLHFDLVIFYLEHIPILNLDLICIENICFQKSIVIHIQLQRIAFQLIAGKKYKTTSKQIHESSVLHKSAQLERAQRRCSASARNSSRPWLSSLPSSSSAVAWSETNSPYSQPSNVGLTIVSQVTLSQWKETWTASSLLLALFLANFLFVATFLQIVAMVGLFPQIQVLFGRKEF